MATYEDYESVNDLEDNASPIPPTVNETLQTSEPVDDLCSNLIPMYNRLVDVFRVVDDRDNEFNLPEIVVVGSQVM